MQKLRYSSLFGLALALLPSNADAAPAVGAISAAVQEVGDEEKEQLPPIEEREDKRDEVKELLAVLDDHVDEGGDDDELAMAVIDDLSREFEISGVKDRAAIAKAVAVCLTVRRRDFAEDVPDETLQEYAGKKLSTMFPEAVPLLIKYHDHKYMRGKAKAQRAVILSMGKSKDDSVVKPLMKLLDEFEPHLVSASMEALGNFTEADERVRKSIVEEILKKVVPLLDKLEQLQGDSSGERQEVKRFYDAFKAPAKRTLELLTNHEERDFMEWRRWWNKNKGKSWS